VAQERGKGGRQTGKRGTGGERRKDEGGGRRERSLGRTGAVQPVRGVPGDKTAAEEEGRGKDARSQETRER